MAFTRLSFHTHFNNLVLTSELPEDEHRQASVCVPKHIAVMRGYVTDTCCLLILSYISVSYNNVNAMEEHQSKTNSYI